VVIALMVTGWAATADLCAENLLRLASIFLLRQESRESRCPSVEDAAPGSSARHGLKGRHHHTRQPEGTQRRNTIASTTVDSSIRHDSNPPPFLLLSAKQAGVIGATQEQQRQKGSMRRLRALLITRVRGATPIDVLRAASVPKPTGPRRTPTPPRAYRHLVRWR
jgi:hypothetical protein